MHRATIDGSSHADKGGFSALVPVPFRHPSDVPQPPRELHSLFQGTPFILNPPSFGKYLSTKDVSKGGHLLN
jgi:hypothetical protein